MANPDFSKVWAKNSPLTPYEFTDSDYLEGWNFVGSTPPARGMFDALQKQNDEKFQYLENNTALNLLQRTKHYVVGDIAYHKNLPSWAYLKCIVEGDTASVEPTLVSAVKGAEITDGTVTWKVFDIKTVDSLPLAGGTMTGAIGFDGTTKTLSVTGDDVTWGGKVVKGMAFPSNTKIIITPNVTEYIAPADGYACIRGITSTALVQGNGWVGVYYDSALDMGSQDATYQSNGSVGLRAMIPVRKGQTIYFNSANIPMENLLETFIYAEGEV